MGVINTLEKEIRELHELEWIAKEAKDYPACLRLSGAIIYFNQFLRRLKDESKRTGKLFIGES